jgi:NAD-dependent deacetylase
VLLSFHVSQPAQFSKSPGGKIVDFSQLCGGKATSMDTTLTQIAHWLASSSTAVAFTGAGISTDSGIPDFRSPTGIWATSQPVYFDEFLRSPTARQEYWRQKAAGHRDFAAAHPNLGHQVLAKWQNSRLVTGLITQNIDGLQRSGAAWDRQICGLPVVSRPIRSGRNG